jgi:hypothetical protein
MPSDRKRGPGKGLRAVHHADVLTLKGASDRLRNRGIDTLPSIRETADQQPG